MPDSFCGVKHNLTHTHVKFVTKSMTKLPAVVDLGFCKGGFLLYSLTALLEIIELLTALLKSFNFYSLVPLVVGRSIYLKCPTLDLVYC